MELQKNKRAIFGIILVIVGAVFLLENLGFNVSFPRFLFQWQIILIIIGAVNLISGNKQSGFILIGVGIFFYLQYFNIIDSRTFWPVILIIVGIVFVLRGKKSIINSGENHHNFFDEVAIFGGSQKKFVSDSLQGGKITNIFGGSEIDLRGAIAKEGAVIEIFTMFGGCDIIVPDNWNVISEVTAIFGGFSDNRVNISEDPIVNVYIKGLTILGGGDLKN